MYYKSKLFKNLNALPTTKFTDFLHPDAEEIITLLILSLPYFKKYIFVQKNKTIRI